MSITDGSTEYSLKTIPSYDDLGYRKPNTAYNIGDIVFCKSLPTGQYLECTTGGISSNNDLIINTITINTTITDNTVVWTIRRLIGLNQIFLPTPNNSAIITIPDNTDLNYLQTPGIYSCTSWKSATTLLNSPINDAQFRMIVFGNSSIGYGGQFIFGATSINKIFYRTGFGNSFTNKWKQLAFEDETFPKYDNAAAHNSIYRGKDLTSYFDSGEMSTAIANGTFADIYPGDYIIKSVTIDGTTYQNVKWIVMDCDYHLNSGDTQTTAHHVVLMPEGHLGTAQMNETNTTEGGYQGSKMWTTTIPLVNAGIKAAFGDSHVLSHRELLTKTINATAVSGGNSTWQGCSVDCSWVSVEANICNEQQVYGTRVFGSSAFDIGDCYNQFAAFRLSKALQSKDRHWFWLRAVFSASGFCDAGNYGHCTCDIASYSYALRPYFLLK